MQLISVEKMSGVLEHICLGLNEVPMFVGQFGAGKTAGVDQFCKGKDAFLAKVLLGQYDTVDLKGTPWVKDQEGWESTVWHPASTLPFKGNPKFPTDRPIVLFLDELTSATVPVMGVCYQLINERRVGEHELMDNVYVVCAGNREIDKGIVNRMPMPLCNRMIWFEVGSSAESWCRYAATKGLSPHFIAYLSWQKSEICTYDPKLPEKVVATPRSIEKAAVIYATTMPQDVKQAAMEGAVGAGWSRKFWGFVDHFAMISKLMPDILKNPATADVPKETSMCYALAVSLSGDLANKTLDSYSTYMKRLPPEYAILIWQLAVARDKKLFETTHFLKFSKEYKQVFGSWS